MMFFIKEYVTPFIQTVCAIMKNVSDNIKRDFGMVVSKKFYDNIKYVLFINRMIGLFPVSVSQKGDSYRLEWSWLRVIVGNFFVLLFAIFTLTGLLLSYCIEEVYNIRIKGIATLMVTLAEVITLLSTWLVGQASISISFKEFWKYLFHMSKADEIMGPLEQSRKTLILIMVVLTFTFTCLGLDIYMWAKLVIPLIGSFNFIWKMVPFYFCYMFSNILEITFWIAVCGITVRTKKLNKLMFSYIDLTMESASVVPSKRYAEYTDDCNNDRNKMRISRGKGKPFTQCKKIFPALGEGDNGSVSNDASFPVLSHTDSFGINLFKEFWKNWLHLSTVLTSTMIKSFITVYDNIAEANLALNKFFGVSVTMVLFNIIVCLIITPYVLYQQILNAKEYKFIFTQSYWMTCHILRLLLLVEPCYAAEIKAEEIKKSVLKMLCLDLPEDAHKQVKILFRVVTENNIHFNARGMTLINRTLLPTIGSAVFTYLAILYQYKSNT